MIPDSFLFIPDISGFADFVKETEISHSRHVISELLEAIIEADTLGMTVSEIEGDAVFFFLEGSTPDLREVAEQARRSGPIETLMVQEFEKPYGADVILAHRLLKNDVQDIEYLLVTDGVRAEADGLPPGPPSYRG